MADVYTPVPWHNADIVARALTILGCNVAYAETQSNNPLGSSFASASGWSLINQDTKRLEDLTKFKTAFCDSASSTAKCAFTTDCGGLPQMIGWMWPGVNLYRYGGLLKPTSSDLTKRDREYQKNNHQWGAWHIIPPNGVGNIASNIDGFTYFSDTFTIDDSSILPGSLIFFKSDNALSHVGIYIGTIKNLGYHLVIESTANKFNDPSNNGYIAGVGFTTIGDASTNFIAPYNKTGLDNTYKYGSRKWRNYSTSQENNCWVAMGRFINVQYDELDITWEPDINDTTKGIFYVTAHKKPSIVYPPETTTNSGTSIFPLNPVTTHVNVKATLFNGNKEPVDTEHDPTSDDKYPEYDGTSGRYSYEWVKQNEGEATETTFAIGLSLKYDLRIGSDIPAPDDIDIIRPIPPTPPVPSDIPEPLDPPSITMLPPSQDKPSPMPATTSHYYHASDLGSTNSPTVRDSSYIDFWFSGKRASDFKLYRTSDGNRYNDYISPSIRDTTMDILGRDGQLWFNSRYEPRKFSISYAFDNLTDKDLRAIRRWLHKDACGELVFTEGPSRAYSVKVTGQPTFNFIPFNTYDRGGEPNVYRGEGKIEFTAYYPYAHTPEPYNGYIGALNGALNTWEGYSWPSGDSETNINDHFAQHYAYYSQGLPASADDYWQDGISEDKPVQFMRNYGDLGMPFVFDLPASTSTLNLTIYKHTAQFESDTEYPDEPVNQLVIAPHTEDFQWNSATGLIYARVDGKYVVRNQYCLKGNTIMALDPLDDPIYDYYAFIYEGGTIEANNIDIKFWYY